MKLSVIIKMLVAVLFISISTSASGCRARVKTNPPTAKKVPPGQAKKAAGAKSAKRFAPGQNK